MGWIRSPLEEEYARLGFRCADSLRTIAPRLSRARGRQDLRSFFDKAGKQMLEAEKRKAVSLPSRPPTASLRTCLCMRPLPMLPINKC